jgi:NAD(P) transhydrogenase
MVVFGSGPSGRRAAVQRAKLGKGGVPAGGRVGGVSVHTDTIPSKTLRENRAQPVRPARMRFLRPRLSGQAGYRGGRRVIRLKTHDHGVEVLEHQFSRNLVRAANGEARFDLSP